MTEFRIGSGFDVHPFAVGRPLILGGVRIEHPRGLDGESDADVLFHAVGDALLGACAEGDLGRYFPPGDPRCKSLDSSRILEKARSIVEEKGWRIVNIDATVIAQEPRLAASCAQMRRNLSRCLALDEERISVKAKTTDHLGFVGRREGIAALVTVLIGR